MSHNTRSSPAGSPIKRPRLTSPVKPRGGGNVGVVVGTEYLSPLKTGSSARDLLSGALNDALKSQEKVPDDSTKQNGSEFGSISGSPVKSPTKGIRRKRRKGGQQNSDYHHTFVMKLFDKSVDLAQFPAPTSLYPVCRAWMRNEPHNTDQAPRERSATPPPPPPSQPPSSQGISDDTSEQDEEEKPLVFSLPPPAQFEGEKCPRIPELSSLPLEGIDLETENGPGGAPKTAPAILLSNHMVRWCEVRKNWKQAALKNEKRYDKSLAILQQMFDDN